MTLNNHRNSLPALGPLRELSRQNKHPAEKHKTKKPAPGLKNAFSSPFEEIEHEAVFFTPLQTLKQSVPCAASKSIQELKTGFEQLRLKFEAELPELEEYEKLKELEEQRAWEVLAERRVPASSASEHELSNTNASVPRTIYAAPAKSPAAALETEQLASLVTKVQSVVDSLPELNTNTHSRRTPSYSSLLQTALCLIASLLLLTQFLPPTKTCPRRLTDSILSLISTAALLSAQNTPVPA